MFLSAIVFYQYSTQQMLIPAVSIKKTFLGQTIRKMLKRI